MEVVRFVLLVLFTSAASTSALKLPTDPNKTWAVLVAGSMDYGNYRHQADLCHSYHILRDHGVPEEQIIVMMVDDIVNDPLNPTKGILVNRPDGEDVYKGVVKDYVGKDVTAENFVNVLLGNDQAMRNIGTGKVLKSGLDNHVFLSYVDHGGPGFLTFPNDYIYAANFSIVLHLMYDLELYGQMVLYIEACNAGSMTEGLLPPNVYSVTAAGPDQQSLACCYDIVRDTTVGDTFSVKWMEDSDMQDIRIETLNTQFAIVRQETITSLVHRYGDLQIAEQPVGEFQGMGHKSNQSENKPLHGTIMQDIIPSREVPLYVLKKKLELATTQEASVNLQKSIDQLLTKRAFLAEKVTEIVVRSVNNDYQIIDKVKNERLKLQDYTCYGEVLEYFNGNCFSLSRNAYVGTYAHMLINMCEIGISSDVMKDAMDETCTFDRMEGIE